MRFSRWRAAGNEYLLAERAEPGDRLTAEQVREAVGESDGILEVVSAEGAEAEIVIWNPDGSVAEMSGNGTRIAARWLAERTGESAVRIRVGGREVQARLLAVVRTPNAASEQDEATMTFARAEHLTCMPRKRRPIEGHERQTRFGAGHQQRRIVEAKPGSVLPTGDVENGKLPDQSPAGCDESM